MKKFLAILYLVSVATISHAQTTLYINPVTHDTLKFFPYKPPIVIPPVIIAPVVGYTTPLIFTVGTAVVPVSPTVSKGTGITYTIDKALPLGMNINAAGVISGTPQASSPATNYTVTAKNAGGTYAASIVITINSPAATGTTTVGGNASPAITAKTGQIINNITIDLAGGSQDGIVVNGVSNVTIKNVKIINGKGFGIHIYGNAKNITVDGVFISNIGFGLYAQDAQTVKVINSQMLNINGINTSSLGHAIQFNNVSGAGNQINNNRIESIDGVALHPHDVINVYASNGLPGDSIQVIGNWIRGGQRSLWPTANSGAAGIVVGDLGGSYQVCRKNILVSPGYVGIQAQGGNHIKVDHNLIYSSSNPASLVGMSWGNYSKLSSTDVTYAYNQVKWFNLRNLEDDFGQNGSGVTLVNNTWGANITADILPATIITMK